MNKEFEKEVDHCVSVLKSGGIILYPTDTVWGLGCDAANEAAVQQIINLKNRPQHKSFVVLVNDVATLKKVATGVEEVMLAYLRTASKPTTVIYPRVKNIASNAKAEDGSVAIRICNEPFCAELIARFGGPILSTSANISGRPTPAIFSEIDEVVKKGVAYIVNYRQQDAQKNTPSTIVKWEGGSLKIIRE